MVEYVFTGEPQRIERYGYRMEAIREIVINMIVHRNYSDSRDSIVKIFDDHRTFFKERNLGGLPPSQTNAVKLGSLAAEFFIPGKLYYDLTIEKLQTGGYPSRCRNTAIAKMFKEMGSIEKYGSGHCPN